MSDERGRRCSAEVGGNNEFEGTCVMVRVSSHPVMGFEDLRQIEMSKHR
jgi:hypothetical protein